MKRALTAAMFLAVLMCKQRPEAQDAANIPSPNSVDEKAFQSTLAAIRSSGPATDVTVYRIKNPMESDFAKFAKYPKAAGYPVLDKKTIPPSLAKSFAVDITNRAMYFPEGDGWTCLWEPGYVVELNSHKQTFRFVVCLKCGDVSIEPSVANADHMHSLTPDGHKHIAADLYAMWPESFPKHQ